MVNPALALVDIRQCTDTEVIKPKVVKETLQWRSEWLAQNKVSSIKPNCQVNWTYNAIISLLFNGKSGNLITDLLYDAIHENNASRKSYLCNPQSSQKRNFINIHIVWASNENCSLWIRNVMHKDFSTVVQRHRCTNTYQTQYNAHVSLMKKAYSPVI